MTKEEKTEMYRKNQEKHIKNRKSKIIALAVVPVVGVVLLLALNAAGKSRQSEIASATVLDSESVGQYLAQNSTGSAIYTGTIKAEDPVTLSEEGGEYIMFRRKVEQEQKIYDKENDKYETETRTISDDSDSCKRIKIDDVVAPYSAFHDLPVFGDDHSDGAASNQIKTSFSYVPAMVDGTYFLKCENGEVSSVRYYKSADVAGESERGFSIAKAIIWIFIIVIEIYLVFDIIKTTKIIKTIGEKC